VHDKQGIADGSAVFAPAFHNLFLSLKHRTTRLIKPNITAKIPVIKKALSFATKTNLPHRTSKTALKAKIFYLFNNIISYYV